MKSIKVILLILVFTKIIHSQNCYIKIANLTGLDMSDDQTSLETAACDLISAFPPEYQTQFKVFDFGFYSLNEQKQGGFEELWNGAVTNAFSQSRYYLAFGRQLPNSNGASKVWIDFKLPNTDLFDCLEVEDINHLKIQVNSLGETNLDPIEFAQIEIAVMQLLQEKINCSEICDNGIDDDKDGWIDCNDPDCIEESSGFRSMTSCVGQAVFSESPNQKFGFDDNKIKSYPTYSTSLGDGIPWKSLGIGVEDQVNVEFSNQLILNDLQYRATGVQILSGNTPQNYSEIMTIKGNSLTQNAKIEVLDIAGNVIGGLMVKVLPAKSMILNLILVKLPSDANYPNVNFTVPDIQKVLNDCYKQVNITWTVNTIDQYQFNFDINQNNTLDATPQEDYAILHTYLRLNYTNLYTSKYYPVSNQNLFNSTSTFILYNSIKNGSGNQVNGWARGNSLYGVVNCTYQHNKRTMAHENGHRIGYMHPWEEFTTGYRPFDDVDSLMDYVNILTGFKLRAYLWKN